MIEENTHNCSVTGHSIWLIPDLETTAQLSQLIQIIGHRFDGPFIPPHVTLLGQITDELGEILPIFRKLGHSCPPLTLSIDVIGFQDFYYRAVYFQIQPSRTLLKLNNRARAQFQGQADPLFFPHLSLLYSGATEQAKSEVLKQLQIATLETIPIRGIELVRTQGEVKDWTTVEHIELR